jgi:hypothetical protein
MVVSALQHKRRRRHAARLRHGGTKEEKPDKELTLEEKVELI